MNSKKFSEAMSELDSKYVDEAVNYKKKKVKKPVWMKWTAAAACISLAAAAAVYFPSRWEPQDSDGGGTSVRTEPEPGHSMFKTVPDLLAGQEIIEEIKKDITDEDIQSWTEIPEAALNFTYLIPVYSTVNMTENSGSILETLIFEDQYKIPAVSNGECIGTFTIMRHEGRWVLGVYEDGLDLESEIKKNEGHEACFIEVF